MNYWVLIAVAVFTASFAIAYGTDGDQDDVITLATIPSLSGDELTPITFTATATGVNLTAGTVAFYLTDDAPLGAVINGTTGVFFWIPTEYQDGLHLVNVTVSDGAGGTDSQAVEITVNETNSPPAMEKIWDILTFELLPLDFVVPATDPDDPPDTLAFSAAGLPDGASIDPTSGAFSWTPSEDQDGLHRFNLTVSDGRGGSDHQMVSVGVLEVNAPPAFDAAPDHIVSGPSQLNLTATDPDLPANTLTYSLVDPPKGASIDPHAGNFSWTPVITDGNIDPILVRVDDGAGGSDFLAIEIEVASGDADLRSQDSTNRPPDMNSIRPFYKHVDECDTLTFEVSATDPDGDALTFEFGDNPSGATIASAGTSTTSGVTTYKATVTWPTTASHAENGGQHPFQVIVNDAKATDSARSWATVWKVLPTFLNKPTKTLPAQVGNTFSYQAEATDECEADGITYSLYDPSSSAASRQAGMDANLRHYIDEYSPPDHSSIDGDTGLFKWTPDREQIGLHHVVIRATDADGRFNDLLFHVRVDPPPDRPPRIEFTNGDQIVDHGILVKLSGHGIDPDGDRITFSWKQVDEQGRNYMGDDRVSLNRVSSTVSQFMAPDKLVDLNFKFTATANGRSASQTVTIHVNDRPTLEVTPTDLLLVKYVGLFDPGYDKIKRDSVIEITSNDKDSGSVSIRLNTPPPTSTAAIANCATVYTDSYELYQEPNQVIAHGPPELTANVCMVALARTITHTVLNEELKTSHTFVLGAYDGRSPVSEVVEYTVIDPTSSIDITLKSVGLAVPEAINLNNAASWKSVARGTAVQGALEELVSRGIEHLRVEYWRCAYEHGENPDYCNAFITLNLLDRRARSELTTNTTLSNIQPQPDINLAEWTRIAQTTATGTVTDPYVVLEVDMINASTTNPPRDTTASPTSKNTRDTTTSSTPANLTLYDYGLNPDTTYVYAMRLLGTNITSDYIPLGQITMPTDTTPPVIVLSEPTNMTIPQGSTYAEPGHYAVDDYDDILTDSVTVTGTLNPSTVGTYRLYYDVSDNSGNPAIQQNRTVNVVEHHPYVDLTDGPSQTILQGSGPYTDPGAVCVDDTDADRPVNATGGEVDAGTAGAYHLTYACIDSDGNPSYVATRTVIVEDAPPKITLNGPAELTVPLNSTYADPGATCIDLTDGPSLAAITADAVDATSAGSYRTTYTCTDSHGHAVNTTRTVTVAAYIIPPSITLIGPSPGTVGQLLTYDDPGALCTDDIDPVRTVYAGSYPDTNIPGNYTLTYTCTDSGGSVAMPAHRTLVVEDLPPEIYVWGENPVVLAVGANFTDSGAGCGDLTDRILNANVTVTGEVDTSIAGTYTITYSCTDSHGHRAEAARTVLVGPPPTGQSPFIVLNGPASATIMQGFPYIDPGAFCTDDVDPVRTIYAARADTSASGSQTLTYACTDSDGNAAIPANRTLVVENSPPYIYMQGPSHIVLSVGANFTDPGADCYDDTDASTQATAGGDAVDTSTVGAYTIIYSCTDSGGLRAVPITRTVLVTSPPGSVPVLALNGSFAETIPQGTTFDDPGALCTDDIDPVRTVYASQPDTSAAGSQTLTYTCTDSNGNAAIPVIRILVVPDAPPVLTLNGSTAITLAAGSIFSDPGATCIDLTDGTLPVVTAGDAVDTDTAGAYTISYTCVDGYGHRAEAARTVNVIAADNLPPVADAGPDRQARPGTVVTLDGTGSSDPDKDIISYVWSQTSGNTVKLSNVTAPSIQFTAPAGPAILAFQLNVTDGSLSSTDIVAVNVTANRPPTVSAGPDQTVHEGATITLNGTASDPDGNPLTYLWTHDSDLFISIYDATAPSIQFTAPQVSSDTTTLFTLTVTDRHNATASDQVTVTIQDMPESPSDFVTTWRTTTPNESITIPVGGAAGTYTVRWGDNTTSTATGDQTHVYTATGDHTIRISGDLTRLHLGEDPANAAKLISIDQWGDVQWTTMREAFAWATNMAYRATDTPDLSRVTDMSLMFTGTYRFNGDLSSWDVSGVANTAFMFFDAFSFDQDISSWDVSSATNMTDMFNGALSFERNLGGWYIMPTGTTINSDDAPGVVAGILAQNTFLDRQNPVYGIGTGGDSASFSMNGTNLVLDAVPDKPTYTVNVTSTGDFGASNHLILDISVTGLSSNSPPVADAGDHQSVQSGDTITLDGTGSSDPDNGDSISYSWSQTSGDTVTLSNSTVSSPTFTAPTGPAVLVFELSVTDTGSLSSTDTVNVTVAAPPNRMPVADAGPDQAVDSGAAVTLDGTGSSDPDNGDSISYSWSQTSGDTVTLSNSTVSSPTFTAPTGPAVLVFELSVTDTGSLSSTDTVNVTVAAPPNSPPITDAGSDQAVASGAAVTLDGTGSSDPDDDVLSYMWSQTSGDTVTLSNSTSPSPTFTAPTGPALLAFLLNVTDGALFSTDTVSVNVAAPPNSPPVLGQIDNMTINEGSELSFVVSAADGNPGDTITYSVSGAPPGAAFNPATGKFSWTPAESQGPGSYMVTFGATDGLDAAEPRTTTITVNEVNQAPLFERSVREGYRCNAAVNSTVTLDFAVTDQDLPAQALAVDDASAGDLAYSAAVINGTLKFSAAIEETDGQQFPDDHRLVFYIVVTDGHDPPGTDNILIRIYLPAASEPDWPDC